MGTQSFICSNSSAFAPTGFCRPQLWTRWVRSFITVHKLSNIEKKKYRQSRDSNPGKNVSATSVLCSPPGNTKLPLFQMSVDDNQGQLDQWNRRWKKSPGYKVRMEWCKHQASLNEVLKVGWRFGEFAETVRNIEDGWIELLLGNFRAQFC